MPDQLRNRRANTHRLAHDVLGCSIRPTDLKVWGDGDHAVFHAVQQRFQFGASRANGGKVFLQAARRPVERHGDLSDLIATLLGNSRRKIAGRNLLRETDDRTQTPGNILRNQHRHQQSQQSGGQSPQQQSFSDLRDVALNRGQRQCQPDYLVPAGHREV